MFRLACIVLFVLIGIPQEAHAFAPPQLWLVIGGSMLPSLLAFIPLWLLGWRWLGWPIPRMLQRIPWLIWGIMVVCFMIGRLFPSDSISNSKEVTIPYFPAESFQRLVVSEDPLLIIDLRDEKVFQYWHIAGSLRSNNMERFYRIIESNPQDWLSRQVVVLCYGGGRTSLMRILYDSEKKGGIFEDISRLRKTYKILPNQNPPLFVSRGVKHLRGIFKDYQLHGTQHVPITLANR